MRSFLRSSRFCAPLRDRSATSARLCAVAVDASRPDDVVAHRQHPVSGIQVFRGTPGVLVDGPDVLLRHGRIERRGAHRELSVVDGRAHGGYELVDEGVRLVTHPLDRSGWEAIGGDVDLDDEGVRQAAAEVLAHHPRRAEHLEESGAGEEADVGASSNPVAV